MEKVSCYDCKYGTWDDRRRINDCHHEDAAFAVARQCYDRQCPYFEAEKALEREGDDE